MSSIILISAAAVIVALIGLLTAGYRAFTKKQGSVERLRVSDQWLADHKHRGRT
jgi:hypothetical protein